MLGLRPRPLERLPREPLLGWATPCPCRPPQSHETVSVASHGSLETKQSHNSRPGKTVDSLRPFHATLVAPLARTVPTMPRSAKPGARVPHSSNSVPACRPKVEAELEARRFCRPAEGGNCCRPRRATRARAGSHSCEKQAVAIAQDADDPPRGRAHKPAGEIIARPAVIEKEAFRAIVGSVAASCEPSAPNHSSG
jgi:hypothetical protein